jgi:alpha-galactosidase
MSPNIWATDLLGVRVIGLCHSVQNTAELLARELGVPLEEVTFDSAGVNHTAWFMAFRRGRPDLIPRIKEVMSARHVDETIPMLARSDDPYQSNERVRAELMQLTGYFHTESSHHASEYWAWFRKTRRSCGTTWTGTGTTWRSPQPRTRRAVTSTSWTSRGVRASGTAASSRRRSWTAS